MAKYKQFQPMPFLPTWGGGSFALYLVSTSFTFKGYLSWIVPLQASPTSRHHLQLELIPALGLGRSSALRPLPLPSLLGRGFELNKDHILRKVGDRMFLRELPLLNRLRAPESTQHTHPPKTQNPSPLLQREHTDIFYLNLFYFIFLNAGKYPLSLFCAPRMGHDLLLEKYSEKEGLLDKFFEYK